MLQCKTLFLAAAMLAGALAMGATPPAEPAKGKDLRWEGSPQIAELSGCTPGCTPGVGSCPSGGCVDLCPVGRTLTVQGVKVIAGGTGDPVASGKQVAFPPTVRLHQLAGKFPLRCDCDPNVWGTDKEGFVTGAGAFTQNPTVGNVSGAAVNDRAGACWSTPVAITDTWGMCGSSHAEVMQGAVSGGSVTTKHLPSTGIWNTTTGTPPRNQYLTCRNVLDIEENHIALELRGSPPARLRGSEWPEAPSTWTAGTWGGSGTALDYDNLSQFGTESVQTLSLSTTYCTSASAAGCNSGGSVTYYGSVTPVLYADPNASTSTYKNPIDAYWKPWVNEVKRDYTLANYPPRTDPKNGVGKSYKSLHRVTATASYSPTDVYSFSEQDDKGILRCGPMLGEPDTSTQSNANAQRVCHYAPSRLLTVADGECLEGATPNNGSCTENLDMMPNDDLPDFSAWVSGPLYAPGGSPAELMANLSCAGGSNATLYSNGYPVGVGCRYVRAAGTCTQTVTYTIPHCSGSCCSGKTQAAWPDCSCSGTCSTPTDPDPPDKPDTTCLCSDKSECPNDDRSQCPSCTCNDGSSCPSGDRSKCPADKPKGCDSTKECCSNPCGACEVQGGHPNCATCTADDTLPGCSGCDSTTTCCTSCGAGQTQNPHPNCGCVDDPPPPPKLCSDGSDMPRRRLLAMPVRSERGLLQWLRLVRHARAMAGLLLHTHPVLRGVMPAARVRVVQRLATQLLLHVAFRPAGLWLHQRMPARPQRPKRVPILHLHPAATAAGMHQHLPNRSHRPKPVPRLRLHPARQQHLHLLLLPHMLHLRRQLRRRMPNAVPTGLLPELLLGERRGRRLPRLADRHALRGRRGAVRPAHRARRPPDRHHHGYRGGWLHLRVERVGIDHCLHRARRAPAHQGEELLHVRNARRPSADESVRRRQQGHQHPRMSARLRASRQRRLHRVRSCQRHIHADVRDALPASPCGGLRRDVSALPVQRRQRQRVPRRRRRPDSGR